MESAVSHGTEGTAAYFISKTQAGARSADELTAQMAVIPRNSAGPPMAPASATCGSSRNVRQEMAVIVAISGPSRPIVQPTRSTEMPVATSAIANTS